MAVLVLEPKASCLPNLWSNHQLLPLEGPRRGVLPELVRKLHWGPHLEQPQKSNPVFSIPLDRHRLKPIPGRKKKKNLWSRPILKFYIPWVSFSIRLPSIFFAKIWSLFELLFPVGTVEYMTWYPSMNGPRSGEVGGASCSPVLLRP